MDIHRADLESIGDLGCDFTLCPQADVEPVPFLQRDASGGALLEAVGLEKELAVIQGGCETLTLQWTSDLQATLRGHQMAVLSCPAGYPTAGGLVY